LPTLVCPVCGTDNPATRQFCRKCASDLHALVSAPGQAPASVPEPAPVPIRPIVIGGGIALVLVIVIMGALVVLGGSPPSKPSPTPSPAPASAVTPTFGPTLTPTEIPTEAPIATPAPTEAATPDATPPGSLEPGASLTPSVDSLSGPRRASCTEANGSAPAGYIHLSWEAVGTTGVRLSIDPPAPNNAYDYGYDDYPAVGSTDVPFTCDPPTSDATGDYHLYVVTTQHEKGYFAYRYLKVYVRT
jgi:hypothetical protein